MIAELHIGSDFDNGARVMAAALFIGVGTENEGRASKDRTGHEVHGDRTAVFSRLKAHAPRGEGPWTIELDIERAGREAKAGFAQVMVLQFFNPEGETAHAGDDFTTENLHEGHHPGNCFPS